MEDIVVVTGGGRGIGRAVCERFAGDGAQVVAAARSVQELEETRGTIEAAGGRCHTHATDVTSLDDVDGLIEATVGQFGRIDVLVNNAGIAPLGRIEELEPEVFDMLFAVNIKAVYGCCRAVWPVMKKQGRGVIVNLSSVASVEPFAGFAAYGASKSWVNAWTKLLAEEGRPLGIHVFAVGPGAVETRLLRGSFPDFPADQALPPHEVANLVHALCQPACRYATGQTVFLKR